MMAKDKNPWMKFFPGDWLKDTELRGCSPGARGVWMDLICYMFECEQRGVLATGGKPWSNDKICGVVSGDSDAVREHLNELLAMGVASRTSSGAITCRRLARDSELSMKRTEAGSLGGRARLLKQNAKQNASKHPSKPLISDICFLTSNTKKVKEAIESIYKAFPLHKKRALALKAIRKALHRCKERDDPVAFLLAKVEAYRRSEYVTSRLGTPDEHFIPHPSSWFNSESYLDEESQAEPNRWLEGLGGT